MTGLRIAVVFSVVIFAAAAGLGLTRPPIADRPVLIISGDLDRVIRDTNGQEIVPNRAAVATLAILADPTQAYHSGAWLVVDGRMLARICGVTEEQIYG